jgi:putative PEP-CTERM system histidine kinase
MFNLIPATTGLALAAVVLAAPRFGKTSWLLSLFLALPAVAFGLQAFGDGSTGSIEWLAHTSFASLVLAFPSLLIFLWTFDRSDYRQVLRRRLVGVLAVVLPAPALAVLLFVVRTAVDGAYLVSGGFVALGPAGYASAFYVLVLSVLALASLEQTLRTVEERVRWEIKFLVLGLAVSGASAIYIASKVLLYSARFALLPLGPLQVFPIVSLLACILVFVSWRRSSGRQVIAVSQSLVYSSITLLGVGIYLIASSLLARWAAGWGGGRIQLEVIVFLLSAVALGMILLWTGFRHRARLWMRRHIFAGRYDYRRHWMEASEKLRSIDSPETAARALAEITQTTLGAIDVSVWLREREPNRLRLLAALGDSPQTPETLVHGIVEDLVEYTEPVEPERVTKSKRNVVDFLTQTRAQLLVPLVSSDRLIAVMTLGSDRSGQPFDNEAREFLKVLAGHAAAEFHKADLLRTVLEAKETEAFRTFSTFLLHDLKNFASTLSLIATNATRHADNPEFQKDAFRSVFDTAEKMKRLCNSLRTFSGNIAIIRRLQDLNQIARDVADSMGDGLGKALRLELEELPQVPVDPEEFARVLQNLLLNAWEAIGDGGEIVLRTGRSDGKVLVRVKDDGKGMSEEFQQNELFHPFRTTKSDGLGIGLFQCRRIIEAHRGTIEVESKVGEGTVVTVTLPLVSDGTA